MAEPLAHTPPTAVLPAPRHFQSAQRPGTCSPPSDAAPAVRTETRHLQSIQRRGTCSPPRDAALAVHPETRHLQSIQRRGTCSPSRDAALAVRIVPSGHFQPRQLRRGRGGGSPPRRRSPPTRGRRRGRSGRPAGPCPRRPGGNGLGVEEAKFFEVLASRTPESRSWVYIRGCRCSASAPGERAKRPDGSPRTPDGVGGTRRRSAVAKAVADGRSADRSVAGSPEAIAAGAGRWPGERVRSENGRGEAPAAGEGLRSRARRRRRRREAGGREGSRPTPTAPRVRGTRRQRRGTEGRTEREREGPPARPARPGRGAATASGKLPG